VNSVIILGIDPGYATLGYGIIEFKNGRYTPINHGAIFTSSKDNFSGRLEIIFNKVSEILNTYKPEVTAVEKLYFQSNHKTAIDVAQARGVILLSAQKQNVPIYEYTPLQVKAAVTGYGKAQKKQVMMMTQRLLRLKELPKPDDTADALAIAICHANSGGYRYINRQFLRA
jgi:crossover junction endodeoxyribonuclease RuvC